MSPKYCSYLPYIHIEDYIHIECKSKVASPLSQFMFYKAQLCALCFALSEETVSHKFNDILSFFWRILIFVQHCNYYLSEFLFFLIQCLFFKWYYFYQICIEPNFLIIKKKHHKSHSHPYHTFCTFGNWTQKAMRAYGEEWKISIF